MDTLLHQCVDSLLSVQGEWDIWVPQVSGLCAIPDCGTWVKPPTLGLPGKVFAWTFGKVWVNPRTLLDVLASFQCSSHFANTASPIRTLLFLLVNAEIMFYCCKIITFGAKSTFRSSLGVLTKPIKAAFYRMEKKQERGCLIFLIFLLFLPAWKSVPQLCVSLPPLMTFLSLPAPESWQLVRTTRGFAWSER